MHDDAEFGRRLRQLAVQLAADYDEPEAHFTQALELRQVLGDRRGCLAILGNLANVALVQNDGKHTRRCSWWG
jgi:hypothetical protein